MNRSINPSSFRTSHPVRVGLLLLLFADACSPRGGMVRTSESSAAEIRVTLVNTPDLTPERWRGMSNIFFDSVPPLLRDSVRTGDAWRAVEVAEVVSGGGMTSIRVARFNRGVGEDVQYVVDTTGDLDFRHGLPLVFERRGAIRVANVELMVRNTTGSRRRVPYQVLVVDDGYTYARIADYRTGTVRVDGQTYAVTLRNRGRSHPFYGSNEYTVFMVDLNADGQSRWPTALRGRRTTPLVQLLCSL